MTHTVLSARTPAPDPSVTLRHAGSRQAGFSFMEILVVMGIIAVLVGLSIGVFQIVNKKGPEVKTRALLMKMRANVDSWHGSYRAWPPSNLNNLRALLGPGISVGKAVPPNDTNWGIESLVQCLTMVGYGHNADIDEDLVNTDMGGGDQGGGDHLDKALAKSGQTDLFEVKDAWGNPLVYFTDGDYAQAEKNPPTYQLGDESGGAPATPKPWRTSNGAFAQQGAYQLYSMGPDGVPNTEDDLKAWTSN